MGGDGTPHRASAKAPHWCSPSTGRRRRTRSRCRCWSACTTAGWRPTRTTRSAPIVLTGAGGSFCAGMDLKALAGNGMAGEQYRDRLKADPDLHWKAMLRHHRPRKPVIAAVEGYCVAGGTEILQGTDIRVAGRERHLRPLRGQARAVPDRRLDRPAATPDPAHPRPGDAAHRPPVHRATRPRGIGLIGHVVPDGTALDKALEIAEQINACGPLAVEAVKASVYETAEMTETEGLAAELARGWPVFDTADAKEGARAFAEKRPPVYRRA